MAMEAMLIRCPVFPIWLLEDWGLTWHFIITALFQKIELLPSSIIILIYLLGFTIIFSKGYWMPLSPVMSASQRLIFSAFFLFVILEQNYAKYSFIKMGRLSFPTRWGKYTYGLYMLHFPVIYVTGKLVRLVVGDNSLFHILFTETVVAFLFSLLAAYASFHYFESYFLQLKNKFAFVKK